MSPKAARRQHLIGATIEVIAEKGIRAANATNISRRAGLSVGMVGLHFGSFDELLIETLKGLVNAKRVLVLDVLATPDLSPADRLRGVIDVMYCYTVCSPEKIAVWYAVFSEASYRAWYRDLFDDVDDERIDAVEELCKAIKEEGGYDHVDTEVLAENIESLTDALWLRMILHPRSFTHETARDHLMAMVAGHFPQHFPEYVPNTIRPEASAGQLVKARTDPSPHTAVAETNRHSLTSVQ